MELDSPRAMDPLSTWMGFRFDDPYTVRLTVRPELLNPSGRMSGVAAYALVDYGMGSAVWEHTTEDERVATLNISITYLRGVEEGDVVCRTVLDRRTRTNAALRSEVVSEVSGEIIVTAVGTFAIYPVRRS